jgi:hypothetical protein
VEYATRDQAQQAITQLSNQNLMGRLVYVREVGGTGIWSGGLDIKVNFRIVRRSLGLSVLRAATVAEASLVAPNKRLPPDLVALLAAVLPAAEVVRSMLPMYVLPLNPEYEVAYLLTRHSFLLTSAGKT